MSGKFEADCNSCWCCKGTPKYRQPAADVRSQCVHMRSLCSCRGVGGLGVNCYWQLVSASVSWRQQLRQPPESAAEHCWHCGCSGLLRAGMDLTGSMPFPGDSSPPPALLQPLQLPTLGCKYKGRSSSCLLLVAADSHVPPHVKRFRHTTC